MRKRERPSAAAGRGEISLNGVWAFRSAADAEWTSIRVPGAYAGVRQSWGGAQWDCFDYPRVWEGKAAVYRRSFLVPDEMQGLDLRFGGYACAHHSEFLLNGEKIGEWHDGYTPFEFPLNAALIVGENIIEVRVSDRPNDLFDDYGTHRRGFWQDTFLKARPWVAVGNDPFVKTSVARGEIVCEIPVENGLGTEAVFAIECVVTGPDGSVAKRFGSAQSHRLAAGARALFSLSAPWSNPRLWFPHDPHLYHVHVRLLDAQGGVLDHLRLRFGFREVTWHGPHLYLNGRELFLRGHGGHYFGDIQGTRAYMETWLGNLRALGVNFMRLHDSPKHRELYEVADELGMLLEAEAVCHFQVPADPVIWQGHLERLIKAQRNHPSVIIWSVSNELRWRGGGEKPEMIAHAKRFDLTRPVFASDFSLESRHGDLCGHHYAPVTVFEDWQRYGPDKPMLWDELGSVWAHDRPLDNGTSGYEAQAQDYATGLWHDGHDQILRDILLHHEGKLFNGELHRVSGFIPWDLSYNFFRWQPTNNNQLLELRHDDLGGPGIKHKHVRPVASPVNPWDPTLPALEPNPGFALFAPFMRPVRFFDDRDERTFFADAEWEASARIIYDDLRLADELVCRVETLAGEALSEKGQPLELAPGRIMENVVCRFSFPAVAHATPVRLVREFRYRGAPGYRDERLGKIFPRVRHPAARIGALGDTETVALERAGVAVARCESGIPDCDLLLAEPGALARADVRAWIERGGRALCCLAGAAQGLSPQNRIMDDFTTANGGLSPDRGLRSANGCVWYGWTQTGEIRLNQPETMSPTYGLAGQLEFNRVTEPGAYVFALFDQPLAHFEEGLLRLRYQTPLRDIEQLARGAARLFNRQVGLLVRDAQGCWFVSDEACAFALGRGGAPAFSPASLEWREVTSLRAGRPYGALETRVGGVPDLSIVTGAGLYQHRVPEEGLPFWLASIEWRGRAAPTALIPFNGPRHRLLEGVDQQDLSFWRGGSSRGILELPERCNYRVVLAGNKDGMGAALYERMIGAGLAVVTALKLDDLDREPAAHGLLGNIIAYLAAYQAEPGGRCAVQVAPELEACLDQVGLVRQDAIAGANVLIIDGPHAAEALVTGVSAQVKAGATLLVCGVEEPHLEAVGRLTGCDLVLTEPYLGERRHCVKA
ncbi:MAG: hypothetical protein K9N49_00830, partial [Candidatus Marinimicrobia bacterium]|nr:hypothetical protein [Candidatus Neomarinimicrobiota bacterium]